MKPRTYNWLVLPLVILIRTPIMGPLVLIRLAGEWAEAIQEAISPYLPGFRYNPNSRSRF